MNEQEKQETVKRLKQNRRNLNFIHSNLNPYDWLNRELMHDVKRGHYNPIIKELESEEPVLDHVCKYPLDEVGKINGWSGFGYEALPLRDQGALFNDILWAECADLLAKNATNWIRFFASFTENQKALDASYHPVVMTDRGWDCLQIDPAYVAKVMPRLDAFHDRFVTTEITLLSGIKGVANRWDYSYFNGKNNINKTTTDLARFYDDKKTMQVVNTFNQNYAQRFKSKYVKFRLLNEAKTSTGRMVAWNNYMIAGLNEVGIENDQIMIQMFDSSKVFGFLKRGIWVVAHTVNSERTVTRWLKSKHRYPLMEYPNFLLCANGGDEFKEALGFCGYEHNPDYRKAAARQERNMIQMILRAGYTGIDFMPALAFVDGDFPNLQRIIDHGEDGFTASELKELSTKLGIDLDYDLNKHGELKECRAAFVNNLDL